jgi:nicotinamide-nucleotide amidase
MKAVETNHDEQNLAARVSDSVLSLSKKTVEKGKRIAVVESCTGGMVAAACTDLSGSSAWFERGWVTYSNEAKIDCVGVSMETLRAHGAVSEPTAKEMAVGGLVHSRADVCVAITGVAGPTGGSAEKPVGMVCFGVAQRGQGVSAQTQHFAGDRHAVRLAATEHALRLFLDAI